MANFRSRTHELVLCSFGFLLFSSDLHAALIKAVQNRLPNSLVVEGDKVLSRKDRMEMVLVPQGPFLMGSNVGHYDEKPEHKVTLDAFLIDKTKVTNAQFQKFVAESGYNPQGPWKRGFGKGDERLPVRFVTWNDAVKYAAWAGKRLPTEAEWEKAARGESGSIYPWGNSWEKAGEGIASVGAFPKMASRYGCLGMAGNAWEWVRDWYDRYYYKSLQDPVANPTGPEDGSEPLKIFAAAGAAAGNERSTLKVIKGGGAFGPLNVRPDLGRSARRMWGNPNSWFGDTGFRTATSLLKE